MTSTSTDYKITSYGQFDTEAPRVWKVGPSVSISPELLGEYKPKSYFTDLLSSRVREAQVKIQENLEHQLLYGNSWVTQPVKAEAMSNEELRRCIADAYDKHIGTNIRAESPIMEYLKKKETKAEDMEDAVRKAMEKRKEARANLVLDFLDSHWGEPEVGETHTWVAIFEDTPDKEYHYAAILCDNHRWYVTNRTNGLTTEALKAEIADICIRAEVYFNGDLVA